MSGSDGWHPPIESALSLLMRLLGEIEVLVIKVQT